MADRKQDGLNRGKVKLHGSVCGAALLKSSFFLSFFSFLSFCSFCSFFVFSFESASELELPSSHLTPDLGGHEGVRA